MKKALLVCSDATLAHSLPSGWQVTMPHMESLLLTLNTQVIDVIFAPADIWLSLDVAALREQMPYGYFVAIDDPFLCFERHRCLSHRVDEVWPLTWLEEPAVRPRMLLEMAELNRRFANLPAEYQDRFLKIHADFFWEQRFLSPGMLNAACFSDWTERLNALQDSWAPQVIALSQWQPREWQEVAVAAHDANEMTPIWASLKRIVWSGAKDEVIWKEKRSYNAWPINIRLPGITFPWAIALYPAYEGYWVREAARHYSLGLQAEPYELQERHETFWRYFYDVLSDNLSCRYHGALVAFRLAAAEGEYVIELPRLRRLLQQHSHLVMIGELAAGTAHEIRNPLTAVRGFVQILQQRLAGKELEKEVRYTHYVLDEIDRTNDIISNFLRLARPSMESAQPVDVNKVLSTITDLTMNQAILRGVTFETALDSSSLLVKAREDALKQVYLNLISNALQATPARGWVRVESRQEGEEIRVSVSDSGEGILPELLPRIFEPFFTTKETGTGIGLALCRQIVEEHEGRIEVESVPGEGSRFIVVLPALP